MIIVNGSIRYKEASADSQIDETTGFPITSTTTWGESIACQKRHAKMNMQAMDEGNHYVDVSYEILIELPSDETFPTSIQLSDNNGSRLGEYVVIRVDILRELNMMKIIV